MKGATQLIPIITAAGLMAMQSVQAAVFDFATMATGNERGFSSLVVEEDGIELTATGHSPDLSQEYFAYLDAPFSGRLGGLGVCKELDGADQCVPSSDDNLNSEELLRITFDGEVTIEEILFRDAEHFATFEPDADFLLSIDGGAFTEYPLTHVFNNMLTGTMFDFVANGDGDELYIQQMTVAAVPVGPEVPVPEPMTLSLLGLGLGAMGWRARQNKC